MAKHWKIRAKINDRDGVCVGYGKPRSVPEDLGRALVKRYPADWDVVERGIDGAGTPMRDGARNRMAVLENVDPDAPIATQPPAAQPTVKTRFKE